MNYEDYGKLIKSLESDTDISLAMLMGIKQACDKRIKEWGLKSETQYRII